MTYLVQKHRCNLPYIWGSGDIWECDDCGTQWKSHHPGNPDYSRWTKVWFRRKAGRLTDL